MRKGMFIMGVAALAVVLATSSFADSRGVEFIEIGEFDTGFEPYSFARNMTDDGSTVISNWSPFGGCALWTDTEGWVQDFGVTSSTCYISGNGATIASRVLDEGDFEHSAKWNGSEWVMLPGQAGNATCDFLAHGTFGVSGDGSTIGGLTWEGCGFARGYTYTDADGMEVRLGILEDSSRVNNLNWDGSVAVGWNRIPWGGWQATRWIDGVPEWIQHPCSDPMQCEENEDFDNFLGEAWVTNDMGTVIAGSGFNGEPTDENPFAVPTGWVWKGSTGEVVSTSALPGAFFLDQGLAFAMSDDGDVVGGRFGFGPFSSATLWTPHTGLMNLNQFLIDQGLTQPFDGWFMVQVNDITPDGKKLLVFAAPPGSLFASTTVMIDISRVSLCHNQGNNPRTIKVSLDALEGHMGHGDFFGTCEAAAGGPRAANAYSRHGIDPNSASFLRRAGSFSPGHSEFHPGNVDAMETLIREIKAEQAERPSRGDVRRADRPRPTRSR